LFFLQTTFIAQIATSFPLPNLVLIFLFAAAFLSDSSDFIYVALLFGFLFDIFIGNNFGVYLLSFTASCALASYVRTKFIKDISFVKIFTFSVAMAFVYNLLYLSLSIVAFGADFFSHTDFVSRKIFFDLIYAGILVYPAMWLISKGKQ
jgi:rod shape-determining protein MreD